MWLKNRVFSRGAPRQFINLDRRAISLLIALALLTAWLFSTYLYSDLIQSSYKKSEKSSVVDIDTNLKIDGSNLLTSNLPFKVNFSKDLTKPLEFSIGKSLISFSVNGQPRPFDNKRDRRSTVNVVKNKATYYDIYKNTNLERIITPAGLKQNYILTKPGHPKSFTETIKTNLTVKLQKDGSLIYMEGSAAKATKRAILATSPKPHLTDAKGKVVSLSYALSRDKLAISLPSLKGLSYPITVDPSIYGDNPGGDLVVDGMEYTITGDRQGANGYNSITVQNGGTLNIQADDTVDGAIIDITNNVLVTGNSQIIGKGFGASPDGQGLTIIAKNVQIDSGARIDASELGYPRASGPGAGQSAEGWLNQGGGGGGYGGKGTDGRNNYGNPFAGGNAYGSDQSPVDLGSGGGNIGDTPGGNGGGAIKIIAINSLINNGSIMANGGNGAPDSPDWRSQYGPGSGSGGSIWIDTDIFSGNGTIAANGGNRTYFDSAGGGGAGGRVAIYYGDKTGWTGTPLTITNLVAGGQGNWTYAENGSLSLSSRPFNINYDHPSNTSINWRWQMSEATDETVGFKIYSGDHSSNEADRFLADVPGGDSRTGSQFYEWTQSGLDPNANYSIHIHPVIEETIGEASRTITTVMPDDYQAVEIGMTNEPLFYRLTYTRDIWHCLPNLLTTTVQGDFGPWNILDWTALPLEPGQAIKFRLRTADSPANLAVASWFGPMGAVINANDWTTNYFGQAYGGLPFKNLYSIKNNQFAQIQVRLEHNGTTAPMLNALSLDYERIAALADVNLMQKRADTSEQINIGGLINTRDVFFEAKNLTGALDSTSVKAQFEVKPVNQAFSGGNLTDGGFTNIGGTSSANLTLSEGDYHWRARVMDDKGRYSTWTEFGDNAGESDFSVDLTAPVANKPTTLSPTLNTTPTWTWQPSTDRNGIKGYYFYLGSTAGATDIINGEFITSNQYTVPTSLNEGTYYAFIKAIDNADNIGSSSGIREVIISSTATASWVPSNLNVWLNGKNAEVVWLPPLAGSTDYYKVYRYNQRIDDSNKYEATVITQTAFTNYIDQSVMPGITYYYQVGAVDQNGDESPVSINVINDSITLFGNRITWTTQRDFKNNAVTTGNKTTSLFLDFDSASGDIKLASDSVYGDGSEGDLVVDGTTASNSSDGQVHDAANPLTLSGVHNYRSVTLQNGAVLTHAQRAIDADGIEGLELYIQGSFMVDATSKVELDGKGYNTTYGGGTGGGTSGYLNVDGVRQVVSGGGGYADYGGNWIISGYAGRFKSSGSQPYGTAHGAEYLGSAGGGLGGFGGGRFKVVAQNIQIGGKINANGLGAPNNGGGGSGGGIYLAAPVISIDGVLSAAGGGAGAGTVLKSTAGSLGTGGTGAGNFPGGSPGIGGAGGDVNTPGGYSAGGGSSRGGGGAAGRIAIHTNSFNGSLVNNGRSDYAQAPGALAGPFPYFTANAAGITGSLGGLQPTEVGLQADAKSVARWKSIEFNSESLSAGQKVLFQIKAADSLEELKTASYTGPDGTSDTWFDSTDNQIPSLVAETRYAEIQMKLTSSTGISPVVHDITLNYEKIAKPQLGDLQQLRVDGSQIIEAGKGTKENQVILKALNLLGLSDSTNLKAQFEAKKIDQVFDGNNIADGDLVFTGQNSQAIVPIPTEMGNVALNKSYQGTPTSWDYWGYSESYGRDFDFSDGYIYLSDNSGQRFTDGNQEGQIGYRITQDTPFTYYVEYIVDLGSNYSDYAVYKASLYTGKDMRFFDMIKDEFYEIINTNAESLEVFTSTDGQNYISQGQITDIAGAGQRVLALEFGQTKARYVKFRIGKAAIANDSKYTASLILGEGQVFAKADMPIEGAYHWRGRVVDDKGRASAWAYFGNNLDGSANTEAETDFYFDITSPSKPEMPTTASPTFDTTPTFKWDASSDSLSGIKGYKFYLGTTPGASDVINGEFTTTNSFRPTSPLAIGSYYAWVKAVDNAGNESETSDYSITEIANVNSGIWAAPSNLIVWSNSTTTDIFLDWKEPPSITVDHYKVYRSNNQINENNKYQATVIADNVIDSNYTDSTGAEGQTYYYQVSAVGADGKESPLSILVINDKATVFLINGVIWTTKGDFENNQVTVNKPTDRQNINVSGISDNSDASLSLAIDTAANWKLQTTPSKPNSNDYDSMAYHALAQKVIYFGQNLTTWTYDQNQKWQQLSPLASPPSAGPMTYDPVQNKVTVYNGQMWTFDIQSNTWSSPGSIPTSKPPVNNNTKIMIFDTILNKPLIFQNDTSQLWAYDINSNQWSIINSVNNPPSRNYTSAFAYDNTYNKALLFGGYAVDDTWIFDSATQNWTEVTGLTQKPSPRLWSNLIPIGNGKFLLFGGKNETPNAGIWLNDTWIFDLNTNEWTPVDSADRPKARYMALSTYDSANHNVLLFGGIDNNYVRLQDTWAYQFDKYFTSGKVSKLLLDAGEGARAFWNKLLFNAFIPEEADIKFRTRGANSETDLDTAAWSDYITQSQEAIQTNPSRFLEVEANLESNQWVTPRIDDIGIKYQAIDQPAQTQLKQKDVDGNLIQPNSYITDSFAELSVEKVKGLSDSTTLKAQFEIKENDEPFDEQGLIDGNEISVNQISKATVNNLAVGKSYHWRVRIVDDKNRASKWTEFNNGDTAFTIEQLSLGVPGTPYTDSPTNNLRPTWSWTAATDAGNGIKGYKFYLGTTPGASDVIDGEFTSINSFTPSADLSTGFYYAYVRAVDNNDNVSEPSGNSLIQIVSVPGLLSKPRNLSVNLSITTADSVDINWNQPLMGDVSYYKVYRAFSRINDSNVNQAKLIATTPNLSFVDASTYPAKTYYYQVTAVDPGDNESKVATLLSSNSDRITISGGNELSAQPAEDLEQLDNTGKKLVMGVAITNGNIYLKAYGLAGLSDSGQLKAQYEIKPILSPFDEADLVDGGFALPGGDSQAGVNLAEGAYHWQARIVDDLNRTSNWTSFGGNAETEADIVIDNTPPAQPAKPSTDTPTEDNKPTWSWPVVTDNLSGIKGYKVYLGTTPANFDLVNGQFVNTNSFTYENSLNAGDYFMAVLAVDNAGNKSQISDIGNVDITFSLPSNLNVVAQPYNKAIEMEWTGPALSEIENYNIYRYVERITDSNKAQATKLGEVKAFTYTDTTTFPGETYFYQVTATGKDGTEGGLSVRVKSDNATASNIQDGNVDNTPPHWGFSPTTGLCKNCHSVHLAKGSKKIFRKFPNIEICFTCHDGSGSAFDIKSYFAGKGAHDVGLEDPEDTLLKCMNCHHPHNAPNWIGKGSGERMTRAKEEQLCFKCHNDSKNGEEIATGMPNDTPGHSKNNWDIKAQFNLEELTIDTHPAVGGETIKGKVCADCHGPQIKDFNYSRHAITGKTRDGLEGAKIECSSCHGPHSVQRGEAGSNFNKRVVDPNNTFNLWTGTYTDFCLNCHRGDNLPTKSAQSDTTFVPYSIQFPLVNSPYFQGWDKTAFKNNPSAHNAVMTCQKCHHPHGSQNQRLKAFFDDITKTWDVSKEAANEEELCLQCHKAGNTLGAPDINTVLDKKTQHPVKTRRERHVDTEAPQDLNKDNRHAECYDCHDPHQAKAGLHKTGSPFAGGPLTGMAGVGVINGIPGLTQNLLFPIKPIVYEYQLCFKCHSSNTELVDQPIGDLKYKPQDKAEEFNTNNPSFHPVEGLGKNLGIKDEAFAPGTPFNPTTDVFDAVGNKTGGDDPDYGLDNDGGVDPSYKGNVNCTDCHNNSDPDGAAGPHGSDNRKLLKKPFYYTEEARSCMYGCHRITAVDPQDLSKTDGNQLCFSCHNDEVYNNGAKGSRFGVNTSDWYGGYYGPDYDGRNDGYLSLHYVHIKSGMLGGGNATGPGYTTGNASCFNCHKIHGSSKKPHLLKDPSDTGQNWTNIINFSESADGKSITCEPSCHKYSPYLQEPITIELAYPHIKNETSGVVDYGENSVSKITYTGAWWQIVDPLAVGERYVFAPNIKNNDGASATISFNGSKITWYSKRGLEGALAQIYLDNQLVKEIDLVSFVDNFGPVFTSDTLTNGDHTLTIKLKYRADNNIAGTSPTNQKLVIDNFRVTP